MKYQKHRNLSHLSGVTWFIRLKTGLQSQMLQCQSTCCAPVCHIVLWGREHECYTVDCVAICLPSPPITGFQDLSKHEQHQLSNQGVRMSFLVLLIPSPNPESKALPTVKLRGELHTCTWGPSTKLIWWKKWPETSTHPWTNHILSYTQRVESYISGNLMFLDLKRQTIVLNRIL